VHGQVIKKFKVKLSLHRPNRPPAYQQVEAAFTLEGTSWHLFLLEAESAPRP
jgi:hypothetical protein